VRGHAGEATHVVVLATQAAPRAAAAGGRRRGLLGRRRRARPRPVAPAPALAPAPVATARATLIRARPFADAPQAERWLAGVDPEAEVAAALAVLNRLLHLHRTATADAAVREVARGQAIAARVGTGAGEQVAEGRFARAVELAAPPPPRRRSAALRPEERLAALLAGRDVPLASEELALRARADLAAGREREAALQLRVALAAALGELAPWAPRGDLRGRLDELRALQPAAEAAAGAALQGGLDDAARADVERVLGRLEAALRARTALGFD
jgi:hypothetical protein